MQDQNLSSSAMAGVLGVQPSTISHILSGRNKPGFDFLVNFLENWPQVDPEWLLLGRGNMYKEGKAVSDTGGDLFEKGAENRSELPESPVKTSQTIGNRTVRRIVLFYSDNSFEEFNT
jgi:transcriptional regulator with XRE-family HTH domain